MKSANPGWVSCSIHFRPHDEPHHDHVRHALATARMRLTSHTPLVACSASVCLSYSTSLHSRTSTHPRHTQTEQPQLNHKHGTRLQASKDQGDHISMPHVLGRSYHRTIPGLQPYRYMRPPHQHMQAVSEAMDRVADGDHGVHATHPVPAVR